VAALSGEWSVSQESDSVLSAIAAAWEVVMKQVVAGVIMALITSTSAFAIAKEAAHKTQISTTIRLFAFDNGKYTAELRTIAMPCPGVTVDNIKTFVGVADEEDAMDKLRDYVSALYASIDRQADKCHRR
jgi:hypothetical protein